MLFHQNGRNSSVARHGLTMCSDSVFKITKHTNCCNERTQQGCLHAKQTGICKKISLKHHFLILLEAALQWAGLYGITAGGNSFMFYLIGVSVCIPVSDPRPQRKGFQLKSYRCVIWVEWMWSVLSRKFCAVFETNFSRCLTSLNKTLHHQWGKKDPLNISYKRSLNMSN